MHRLAFLLITANRPPQSCCQPQVPCLLAAMNRLDRTYRRMLWLPPCLAPGSNSGILFAMCFSRQTSAGSLPWILMRVLELGGFDFNMDAPTFAVVVVITDVGYRMGCFVMLVRQRVPGVTLIRNHDCDSFGNVSLRNNCNGGVKLSCKV